MSSLNAGEKHILEQYLEMGGGYVLDFKGQQTAFILEIGL